MVICEAGEYAGSIMPSATVADMKDGRFATGVLHLWHPENDRSRLAENERILAELMRGDRLKALVGLSAVTSDAHSARR